MLTVAALLACVTEPPQPPKPPAPNVLTILSGNGQSALQGRTLSQPLVVQIARSSGDAAPGVAIAWVVTTGRGSLRTNSATTDAQGQAAAWWTLGPATGMQSVTATAPGVDGSPAGFTATARLPIVIQRYNGATWQPEVSDSNGALLSLASAWGSSASAVFAVGGSCNGATIMRYDGNGWTSPPPGCVGFVPGGYSSVWGTSAADVFAVGGSALPPSSQSVVVHYDGQQWTQAYHRACSFCARLVAVWSTSAADAYVVGDSGIILHYDGTSWQPQASGTTYRLEAIWGSSGRDIFAVGAAGTIRHYDGTTWQPQSSGTTALLRTVRGASATDVFAVGASGTIVHYDGVAWTPQSSGTTRALYGVWESFDQQAFAVGDSSTILHYDGVTWTPQVSGAPMLFLGVWGSSTSNVLAVGQAR
jgi:hypothetical protein